MKTIRKFALRASRVELGRDHVIGNQLTHSTRVARIASALIEDEPVEVMIALYLNAKHVVTGYSEIARGGIESCGVMPCDIFRTAIMLAAPAVIIAHNHPSGDSEPSPADNAITKRVVLAGELLGIRVLDHVIVGHDTPWYSYCDRGMLKSELLG